MTLKAELFRRKRRNFAFIVFQSPQHDKRLSLGWHKEYQFTLNSSLEVFVGSVPTSHTINEIWSNVEELLASDPVSSDATFAVRLGYKRPHDTSRELFSYMEEQLKSIVSHYVEQDQFKLHMANPSPSHLIYRDFIQLTNASDTVKVHGGLNESKINGSPIECSQHYFSRVIFSQRLYKVVKSGIQSALTDLEK